MKIIIGYKSFCVALLLFDFIYTVLFNSKTILPASKIPTDISFVIFKVSYLAWNSYNLVQLGRRRVGVGVYLSENVFSLCRILIDVMVAFSGILLMIYFQTPVLTLIWPFFIYFFIPFPPVIFLIGVGLIAIEVFYIKRLDVLARGKEKA